MQALLTTGTIIFGLIAVLFGTVKGIRDYRAGRLVFTEFRMVLGGLLMATSTGLASILTPVVLERREVAEALAAIGELPIPAEQLSWWLIAITCWGISIALVPGPRAMMEEYSIERHGVAGMLLNQANRGNGFAGR